MQDKLLLLGVILVTVLTTTACSRWTPGESWSEAVLSDDESSVAIIRQFYMGQNTITHIKKKDVQSQIFVSDFGAVLNPVVLSDKLEGFTNGLYYAASQEYIVINRYRSGLENTTNGNCLTQHTQYYADIVRLDGTVTAIDSVYGTAMVSHNGGQSTSAAVKALEVVPSPDGSVLALIKGQQDCEMRTATLTFLDPLSLDTVDGPFVIEHIDTSEAFGPMVEFGWLETNEFFVGTWGSPLSGKTYAPQQEPSDSNDLSWTCLFPKTTTTALSYSTGDGEDLLVNDNVDEEFGCTPE